MHPTYLRNIARCHQNLGNPDKAISSFREYLRKARDLHPRPARRDRGLHHGDGAAQAVEDGVDRAADAAPRPPRHRRPRRPPSRPRRSSVRRRSTASGARDDEGGPFYTRVWFWARGRGRRGGRRRHGVPAHARQRTGGGQPGRARPAGQPRREAEHRVPVVPCWIVALAMIGACAKDKTTALDLQLDGRRAMIDQVRIDALTLGGAPVAARQRRDAVPDIAADAEDRRRAHALVCRQRRHAGGRRSPRPGAFAARTPPRR